MIVKRIQTEHIDMHALDNNLYLQTYNYYDIDIIWQEIEPLLSKRLFKNTYGRYTIADVRNEITKNKQQIWLARNINDDKINMVCLTEVMQYPQYQGLFIFYVSGKNINDWFWILDHIEKWAIQIGCKTIEAVGRKGWDKFVTPKKYKKQTIYTKELWEVSQKHRLPQQQ